MSAERELKPTIKRRQEARREGRVAASSTLVGGACWLGMAAVAALLGHQAIMAGKQAVALLWSRPITRVASEEFSALQSLCWQAAIATAGMIVLIFAVTTLARIAQVGFLWAPTRLLPQAQRIHPGPRLAGLFSADKCVHAVLACSVFVLFLSVLSMSLWYGRESILRIAMAPDVGEATFQLAIHGGLWISGGLFVIGLLDYAYQHVRFEQSLQMTPEELRAEIQAVQENPQIGAGRRGLRQQIQGQTDSARPG